MSTYRIRALFVHYPHAHQSARLSTMPFAINAIMATAKRARSVHVCLRENDTSEYSDIFNAFGNVYILALPRYLCISRLSLDVIFLRVTVFIIAALLRINLLISLGQKALVATGPVSKLNRIRSFYLNDEFPSCWPSRLRSFEIQYALRCQAIIVPDPCRINPLRRELGDRGTNIKYITIYNSPPCESILAPSEIKASVLSHFNIPVDTKLMLNAGSIADWAQIPEILTSLSLWREDFSLLIHSRAAEGVSNYVSSFTHLSAKRLYWSLAPLSPKTLMLLVKSAFATTVLYRNSGPNISYIGLSSGKIARSIYCGTPVICSNLPSLAFIDNHKLGVCVKHPLDIPEALIKLSDCHDEMVSNCKIFAATHFNRDSLFEDYNKVIDEVMRLESKSPRRRTTHPTACL